MLQTLVVMSNQLFNEQSC